MNNYIVFHYKDHDGLLSGWITFLAMKRESVMIPYHYGESIEAIQRIPIGSTVYMVDVSLEAQDMVDLAERTNLTWIDHHASANTLIAPLLEGKAKVIYGTVAACRLCWQYFFPNRYETDFVYLLGKYDVFDKSNIEEWNTRILPLEYAVRGLNMSEPKDFHAYLDVSYDRIEKMCSTGSNILDYLQGRADKQAENSVFLEWEGVKCMVISGETGDFWYKTPRYMEAQPDMLVFPYFQLEKRQWAISLRKGFRDVDTSEIARKYGGNGHRAASGFRVKELPF